MRPAVPSRVTYEEHSSFNQRHFGGEHDLNIDGIWKRGAY